MTGLEGLFAIIVVALMPVALVFLTRYYSLREKQLAAQAAGDVKLLEDLTEAKKRLEARVETLETIVCNVEFELEKRLLKLPAASPVASPALPSPRLASVRPQAADKPRARRRRAQPLRPRVLRLAQPPPVAERPKMEPAAVDEEPTDLLAG